MSNTNRLIALGLAPELAEEIANQIAGAPGSVAWANVTGTQAGVETAVAAKPEIVALTSASTAEDIVAALQA